MAKTSFKRHETVVKTLGGTITFEVEGKGLTTLRGDVTRFKVRASDLSPFYMRFGSYMLGSIDQNFASEGRPDEWAALAPSTIQARIYGGFGFQILTKTRKLRKSFRLRTTKVYMAILTTSDYWVFHQEGTSKMPQRIISIIQHQDRDYMVNLLGDYLQGEM